MISAAQQPEFEQFVVTESPRLLRFAFLLVGDHGHAEDLLQTALFRTARRWRTARERPGAYTRRTLVNLVKDRARTTHRRVGEASLEWDAPAAGPGPIEDRDVLLQACRRLPARQRATLVLRFFEDLSVEQTAAILRCSAGTVKSQTHKALAALRELLPDDYRMENVDVDR